MILACIFDLDGVICHTDEFHYRAWKELCDQYGWKFDRALNNQLRGVSRRESLGIILRANGVKWKEAECQALMDVKNHAYRALLMTMTPSDLEADVVPTLEQVAPEGECSSGWARPARTLR
ncbi:MAG: HAD hydrolase-like protein [Sphaerochaeta sp.]|jgi:beta-phosphoglucomutase-like phosphatase (HAD superfamily)|nr:HAD hydrolase-like protein [Sphaerochaeta sp.]